MPSMPSMPSFEDVKQRAVHKATDLLKRTRSSAPKTRSMVTGYTPPCQLRSLDELHGLPLSSPPPPKLSPKGPRPFPGRSMLGKIRNDKTPDENAEPDKPTPSLAPAPLLTPSNKTTPPAAAPDSPPQPPKHHANPPTPKAWPPSPSHIRRQSTATAKPTHMSRREGGVVRGQEADVSRRSAWDAPDAPAQYAPTEEAQKEAPGVQHTPKHQPRHSHNQNPQNRQSCRQRTARPGSSSGPSQNTPPLTTPRRRRDSHAASVPTPPATIEALPQHVANEQDLVPKPLQLSPKRAESDNAATNATEDKASSHHNTTPPFLERQVPHRPRNPVSRALTYGVEGVPIVPMRALPGDSLGQEIDALFESELFLSLPTDIYQNNTNQDSLAGTNQGSSTETNSYVLASSKSDPPTSKISSTSSSPKRSNALARRPVGSPRKRTRSYSPYTPPETTAAAEMEEIWRIVGRWEAAAVKEEARHTGMAQDNQKSSCMARKPVPQPNMI